MVSVRPADKMTISAIVVSCYSNAGIPFLTQCKVATVELT